MPNDDVDPNTLRRALEAAHERIADLEAALTEAEAERNRWRSLLEEVVGAAVAERMWRAGD